MASDESSDAAEGAAVRTPGRPVSRRELRERGAFAAAPPAPVPQAPERIQPAPVTAAPPSQLDAAAPVLTRPELVSAAPAGIGLTHHVLGASSRQLWLSGPELASRVGQLIPLERDFELLPELEGEVVPKKLWRQPAFIVASSAALLMVIAFSAILILQSVFHGPDKVENLTITDLGAQYFLQWDGPNVPYSVVMTGNGSPADLSDYIKDGRTLWLPKSAKQVNGDSCFVVRSQAAAAADPSTSGGVVSGQGGQQVCVSDAKAQK